MLMIVGFFSGHFPKDSTVLSYRYCCCCGCDCWYCSSSSTFPCTYNRKVIILDAVRSRTCAYAQAYPRPPHAINDKTRKIKIDERKIMSSRTNVTNIAFLLIEYWIVNQQTHISLFILFILTIFHKCIYQGLIQWNALAFFVKLNLQTTKNTHLCFFIGTFDAHVIYLRWWCKRHFMSRARRVSKWNECNLIAALSCLSILV